MISVVIPIGPGDLSWLELLDRWPQSKHIKEIIFSAVVPAPADWVSWQKKFNFPLLWIHGNKAGRATQQNIGFNQSAGACIWFLHCDSEVTAKNVDRLVEAIEENRSGLFYFDLKFSTSWPLMWINEIGAWIRCRYWGLPFGDQGFCLSRQSFQELGLFNENLKMGEDLELALRCQFHSYPLIAVGSRLQTSARKYIDNGWWRTTRLHVAATFQFKKKIQAEFKNRVAVVVFVKTTGISAVKTRLAKTEGQNFAESFYLKSVDCIRDLLNQFRTQTENIDCYWAVAENLEAVAAHWPDFLKIEQSAGSLGDRLHSIYDLLIQKHKYVVVIGSDSPQLSVSSLNSAVAALQTNDFVLGPAHDGGFYLFAGRSPITKDLWTAVPYSADNTAQVLIQKLGAQNIKLLEPTFDIDTAEDIQILKKHFNEQKNLSPAQQKLLEFIQPIAAV